jgi:hypothetical protein
VPFTFHVTVCVLFPAHETAVFGAVTLNGPDVLTVTVISVNCVCPVFEPATYGLLSLTVNLKLSVLATELKASMFAPASPPANGGVTINPLWIVDSLGNVLVGELVGTNDNQFGPVAFVGLATLLAPDTVELSFCSHW